MKTTHFTLLYILLTTLSLLSELIGSGGIFDAALGKFLAEHFQNIYFLGDFVHDFPAQTRLLPPLFQNLLLALILYRLTWSGECLEEVIDGILARGVGPQGIQGRLQCILIHIHEWHALTTSRIVKIERTYLLNSLCHLCKTKCP